MSPMFERIVGLFCFFFYGTRGQTRLMGMSIWKSVDWSLFHPLQSFLCPLSGEYYLDVRFHQTCLFVVDSRAQKFIFKSEYMIFEML